MNATRHAHALRINALFGRIAGVYDLLNRVFSLGLDAVWRKRLAWVAGPLPAGSRVLDLAAGTLKVSAELLRQHPGCSVLAADFCRPMLLRGLANPALHGSPRLRTVAADALSLPLAGESIQAVTLAFGLRNMEPRADALKEILRVLKPGGKLCVLEFAGAGEPILFGLYNLYLAKVLPLVGGLVSKDKGAYRHLADSVASFPDAAGLSAELLAAGFVDVLHERMSAGIVNLHIATKHESEPGGPA